MSKNHDHLVLTNNISYKVEDLGIKIMVDFCCFVCFLFMRSVLLHLNILNIILVFPRVFFFLFHKCPLLLLVPYKSDSRAVNRDWAPLGFGTPLGGKLGFFSTSSAPAWLVLPKMDQCHCLYLYLGKYFTFFFHIVHPKKAQKYSQVEMENSWDGDRFEEMSIW